MTAQPTDTPSLQQRYAPNNACFGCGVANERGLRIQSYVGPDGEEIICEFNPAPHHAAFGNILNGGIIGTVLDCHSNWTAAYHLMKRDGADAVPCTVTADFHVKLKRPTPLDGPVRVRARPLSFDGPKVVIEATMEADIEGETKVTATCRGTFVAVQEGHPAFHRW